jgi:hypothetical protein
VFRDGMGCGEVEASAIVCGCVHSCVKDVDRD